MLSVNTNVIDWRINEVIMERAIEALRRFFIAATLLVGSFYSIAFAWIAYDEQDTVYLLVSLGCGLGALASYRIINWIFQYGE